VINWMELLESVPCGYALQRSNGLQLESLGWTWPDKKVQSPGERPAETVFRSLSGHLSCIIAGCPLS
jgi:hypothetical protein